MKRFLPLLIGLIVLLGLLFLLMRPSKSGGETVRQQKTEATVEATDLYRQFITDESAANEQYLNKILAVSGTVSRVHADDKGNVSVTLETNDPAHGVKCRLDKQLKHGRTEFQVGENVTFKGVCTGYVGDVELVQCVEK